MKGKVVSNWIKFVFKYAPIFFGCAMAFCTLFLLIGEFVAPSERDPVDSAYELFDADWYHITSEGERVPVSIPGQVEAKWGEVVTVATTLPTDVENGDTLCFRPIWQDLRVYVDGKLRTEHDSSKTRPFGTNSAFRYVFVELKQEDAGKEITCEFVSNSKYSGTFKHVYYGDRSNIWIKLIYDAAPKSIAALTLGFLGAICVFICFVLKIAFKKPLDVRYLAWALFLCAWWMLSEMEFRQLLIKNVSIWTNTTYWSLMLIAFPLLLYINAIQKGRYKIIFASVLTYSAICFVVGTVCQMLDIAQFVSQLPFIHGGLIMAIASVIGTLTWDTMKGYIKDYMVVAIGIYGMLFSAILEMVFYYLEMDISIGTILAVGLMFLLVMAVIKTGRDMLLEEKKKQEAVGAREAQAKFLANMSHEIRTPINAVIGMNEMILREAKDETIREYARNVQRASSMLLELVTDILDFSKIESGQLELVENVYYLGNVLQDEKLLLDARIGNKPIDIEMNVDSRIPSKLFGDELRIKQILTNILSNAAKYTEKGSIKIDVSFQWLEAESILLCFRVEDTGKGIKEEDIPALFDEFRRLNLSKNRNIEGTGLGLNIVKQLVNLMRGNIQVNSTYGKGSTFLVCVPQKVEDKRPIGEYQQLISEGRKGLETEERIFTAPDAGILVVDDNGMNLTLMKELLKRTQMQVDLARSGMECIRMTKQKQYDLILMDHMMPGMDGVETLHKLRADEHNQNKNTKVIALTANAVAGCREMYLNYGFDDYISKPIQAQQLDDLILQYLPEELVSLVNPEELVNIEVMKEETDMQQEKAEEPLLQLDRKMGLSFCMDMEEIYQEMLREFCDQEEACTLQLEKCLTGQRWHDYAVQAHAIKSNAKTIGAVNFAELSLRMEEAGNRNDAEFIEEHHAYYIKTLQALIEKIRG